MASIRVKAVVIGSMAAAAILGGVLLVVVNGGGGTSVAAATTVVGGMIRGHAVVVDNTNHHGADGRRLLEVEVVPMDNQDDALLLRNNESDNKIVRALIGEKNSDEDGVNPFIIGGTTLDQTVWEQSRRYLVDIKGIANDGTLFHSCGGTKISNQVVLTAARELILRIKNVFLFLLYYVFDEILTILVHRSMSSTSLLSSLDCFTQDGDFVPQSEIQFNRYAQDDNDGVITVRLCQTEGGFECEDDLAYVVRYLDYVPPLQNDVALIFMPPELPVEDEQRIANLPNVALNCDPNIPVDGQELEAFGWGRTCEPSKTAAPIPAPGEPTAAPTPSAFIECPFGEEPNEIQTGTLEYLTNQECNALWGGGITDDMLCAKTDSTNGVAVGIGDSGMCNSWASNFRS